jgi:endothelin-converting enzyme/putative endopeptidase
MRKLALLALLLACKSAPEVKSPPVGAAETTPSAAPSATKVAEAQAPAPGIDLSIIDRSVNPCDDFYRFSCGKWLERTPIPPDRPLWGRSFSEVFERNQARLREIVEGDARGEADPADPYARKVGDFYSTCMDEHKAETASLATLREELAAIDAVADAKALAKEVGELHRAGAHPFFAFYSRQDAKDATQVIGAVDQGGLGLPDRDYYFKDDKKAAELRALYVDHVGKMLELAGEPAAQAQAEAKRVMELETRLAKASMDRVSRRDPNKTYHRLDRRGLVETAPDFDWADYFAAVGAPEVQAINVTVPDFFKELDGEVTKLDDLRPYLRFRALEAAADALGKAFVDERFRFTRALSGAKQILPRWKRCVTMTDHALGEALGRTFVTTTVGAEGKDMAREMITGIEKAFEANLATLDWMDQAAKTASLYKLHKIYNKVAYPEKWRDYSRLTVGRESLLANLRAAAAFETARDLAKIGKPLDRGEWRMTPPTVNAYYSPPLNEMVFPAGIMQLPFFSPEAPLPSNYGGLGMVMGHELTHGFDDQGRKFDGDGNLHEWWSPEVNKAFVDRAECVAKQYDGYIAVDDVHLNGHLTLGENIGDIGGLKMMLAALRARLGTDRGTPSEHGVPGFTPEQQAFIAFGQVWCTNYRPEAARTQALTNPHSTGQWRVNGPVSDTPDFAKAFSCKAGSPMAPVEHCTVW